MVQIPLIFAGLTFVVGAAIMAGAVHIAMVIVGRLILGLGVGVGTTVSKIHVCMQSLGHPSTVHHCHETHDACARSNLQP